MEVYGSVIYNGAEFDNEAILSLPGNRTLYGIDWVYGGDQSWEESNIYVQHTPGAPGKSFGGRTGLLDALRYARAPVTA